MIDLSLPTGQVIKKGSLLSRQALKTMCLHTSWNSRELQSYGHYEQYHKQQLGEQYAKIGYCDVCQLGINASRSFSQQLSFRQEDTEVQQQVLQEIAKLLTA
jgi:hypothetical protein